MNVGWQKRSLGELCQLISGQHIDVKDYNVELRGVGYLTGPSDFGPLYPVVSKWTEHPKVKSRSGDILITVKGSGVGRINLLDQDEVAISRQLMAIRVNNASPRFVHAFLIAKFDHFQSLSTGAAIPGISREQVLGLEISVPSLSEQCRIVTILDKAFDGIATAKANAKRNLQSARTLFESHLHATFARRDDEVSLSELATDITDGDHSPPPKAVTGVPFITISDIVKRTREIDFSSTFKVPQEYFRNLKPNKKPQLVLLRQV